MRKTLLGVILSATMFSAVPSGAVTLSNAPAGSDIGSFGFPDTLTYGQVFTAPVTGTLTSFTLWLNDGVGALFGGVGTWNGGADYAPGAGSPANLYQSAVVPSSGASSYTFTPNVAVASGSRYVAYISAFGVDAATTTTRMPTGTDVPGLDYFVWNNTSDPMGNASWNYFADYGDVRFSATFDGVVAGVPEPATWGMMLLGFGVVGSALRRGRSRGALARI